MRAPVLDQEDTSNAKQDALETFLSGVEIPDDLSGLEPYIGYIRVSTWKEEKISPQIQKAAIEEWARRTRRRIIRWVVDLDMTGRNFKRKVMRAIEGVERDEAKGIAVWKYSRFGRNRDGIAVNLKRVESVGGHLESATEQIDARTALGKLQRGILFEFAAYESDRAGEQWKETHQLRREAKLPATGRARFGYTWHPRRVLTPNGSWTTQKEWYEVCPELGPVVAELYRMYIAGSGFPKLSAWLTGQGYTTTRGTTWRAETLKRFMDSGFAAGLLRFHDPKCTCDNRLTNGGCPNHFLTEGAHEELIALDLWQQYQARRQQVRNTPPRQRQATYTLTGLPRCGSCRGGTSLNPITTKERKGPNGSMIPKVTTPGHAYRCSARTQSGGAMCEGVWIQREKVEKEVFEWLSRQAAGVDQVPATAVEQRDADAERARVLKQRGLMQAEHAKYVEALTRLAMDNAVNPEKYPEGTYEAARDRLMALRDKARGNLAKLAVVDDQPSAEDFRPLAVGLVEEWETLLVVERNAILRQLMHRVVLTRHGSGADNVTMEIQPVWEPDPWAPEDGSQSDTESMFEIHSGTAPELQLAG
ncbi:recombinase family protein [Streptomyces sp. RKAG293]|uniref:recombinase family protein n=1 Tax=Streptomyces sp. RKAG293 TaxID=2893403 RepID=UPI0020344F02|nr:recombinase family protein [Streptomyces sp. RKAG293]MCM2420274.1 recombinase family protein [Streptomyces sp. RKAG293]